MFDGATHGLSKVEFQFRKNSEQFQPCFEVEMPRNMEIVEGKKETDMTGTTIFRAIGAGILD
jgi:hypothetical protein